MKTIKFLIIALLTIATNIALAQDGGPQAPQCTFAFDIKVKCSAPETVGATYFGKRIVIPIIGGTFEGPGIKGEVLPGGADYQYLDTITGRTQLEAIYCIKTDDNVIIHVRNKGMLKGGKDSNGKDYFYFRTVPTFEAPLDSKYAWLNDSIFICTPYFIDGFIGLRMWKVD